MQTEFTRLLRESGHTVEVDSTPTTRQEGLSGTYHTTRYDLVVDGDVELTVLPYGIWLIGAHGRIDVKGPSGTEKLIYLERGGTALRVAPSCQSAFEANTATDSDTMHRLVSLTCDSIERWTVKDIVDALSRAVDENRRGQVKQIYDYRNWVAHGRNPKRQPPARTDARTVATKLTGFLEQSKDAL